MNTMQPGTILACKWGYDQTNVDFYIVLTRKGNWATIQEIGQTTEYDNHSMTGRAMPDKTVTEGEPLRRKVQQDWNQTDELVYPNKYVKRGAYVWDGTPQWYSTYA